jgi:ubiquinone/menaquinone biosynthesis C-methylase UbiE
MKIRKAFQAGWGRLVRFGFRLLYQEMAWIYDVVSWIVSLGRWRAWQRTLFDYLETSGPILELAHGTGNIQIDLHARGYRTVALDASAQMGRIARRKLLRNAITPKLVRAEAGAIPFPSYHFGAVIATFPTPFIAAPETLQEVARVLQSGGKLIVVMGAQFTRLNPAERILEFAYRVTGQREGPQTESDAEQIAARFRECGLTFEIVREDLPRSMVYLFIATKSSARP